MLISYTISNFLSFDSPQKISMVAGSTKRKSNHYVNKGNLKILKFGEVFGANASGKSNFIKAVAFFKKIVLEGVKTNFTNLYYRGKQENKEKVSSFDFEIEIDNKFYTYGFDMILSKNSIRNEWLYELTNNDRDTLIFSRSIGENILLNEQYFDDDTLTRLKIYYSDMKNQDNILFLTLMNTNKDTLYEENKDSSVIIFRKIFNRFLHTLVVIFPDAILDATKFLISEEKIGKLNALISNFGTGISFCTLVDCDIEELQKKTPPQFLSSFLTYYEEISKRRKKKDVINPYLCLRLFDEIYLLKKDKDEYSAKKIIFKHHEDDGEYSFSEESDGTKRLFDLVEILMNEEADKVYFIDELNRCFHPELSYEFIKSFFLNKVTCQLIVTTHETHLLDLDLVRRDEIWFCERTNNGPTSIYSLEEFGERFDKKVDKAYLAGRYGGVPTFTNYLA